MHTELLSWSATAPGAGPTAAAAVTGDSLTIRNGMGGSPLLVAIWARQQVAGFQQIAFPSGHDTTRGYRFNVGINEQDLAIPMGLDIEVQAQETMSVSISGSAGAGDVELGCALVHYPNLPGVTQRMISYEQLKSRMTKMTTISSTISGTAAGYTGTELITAESDLLRANTDYAVLGITTNTACGAVGLIGPDTGFTRIACPGEAEDGEEMSGFFCKLSRAHGMPFIPVINSGNKASTSIFILQDENNITPLITVFLAQLGKAGSAQ